MCSVFSVLQSPFEPQHDKTNKMTCMPTKDSDPDQSSLCAQWVAKDPRFLQADSEDSDQTGQMPELIRVFAGCMSFFGFVMRCSFILL